MASLLPTDTATRHKTVHQNLTSNISALNAESAVLSSAITAEANERVSVDASISAAASTALSTALAAVNGYVAGDQSLTTRVSIEESTRLAQDNLKLDKSGGTVDGDLAVGTLTANGAATFNSTLTADTITNYAADVTVSALLALSAAASAKKRIASVTGAYRLDGTIGRVEAFWDGDSSAGVWRISGSGVAVTAEFDAWARSCAQVGVNIPAVSRNGHWFRSYPLPWRGLPSSAWAVTSSGSAGSITYLSRMNAMYSASGAYGYSRRALSEVLDPRYSTHSYVACASPAAASSTAEPLYAFIGYISQADIVPLSSQQCAVALYDPDNKLGLGVNNSNVWLVTRTFAGVATIIDSGVAWQINNTTPREYQIVTSPTSVRLYSSGTLVAESSTNLPGSAVFATEGIVKVSGAVVRALYINGQHVTQAAS